MKLSWKQFGGDLIAEYGNHTFKIFSPNAIFVAVSTIDNPSHFGLHYFNKKENTDTLAYAKDWCESQCVPEEE
jgi:hypothetical protein